MLSRFNINMYDFKFDNSEEASTEAEHIVMCPSL